MERAYEKFNVTPQMLFDGGAKRYLANSLLIMRGKFGGGFYVKFLQDAGSKKGWLLLIIVYPDSQYKSVILYKNLFKQTDLDSDNLGSVYIGEGEAVIPRLEDSLEKGDYRMLEGYETPQMPIPSKTIWKLVMDNFEKIPITTIYETEDMEGIYWRLYQIAHEEFNSDMGKGYRENDVRFLVTKEEMEKVAVENGMTLSCLRMELNLLGLLIKDKGSCPKNGKRYNSYQLTKKVDGVNQRFYALKKGVNNQDVVIDESCAIEFTTELSKTRIEVELEDAQRTVKELNEVVEEKKEKIRKIYMERVDDITQKEFIDEIL